jgi:hypothetical protein
VLQVVRKQELARAPDAQSPSLAANPLFHRCASFVVPLFFGPMASTSLHLTTRAGCLSISIPLRDLGAARRSEITLGANESWGLNVSCSGGRPPERASARATGVATKGVATEAAGQG